MNFDEPSHEQTSPTVESVCSSIRMLRHLPPLVKTRDRVPETGFGQVFFLMGTSNIKTTVVSIRAIRAINNQNKPYTIHGFPGGTEVLGVAHRGPSPR